MGDITIRPATRDDGPALGRYGGALMRQHHEFDPLRFVRSDSPEAGYGRFLVSQLGEPGCVVLVAERAGAVVGYAYAGLEPMSWKDLRGAPRVVLMSAARNESAPRLFERLGFRRTMVEMTREAGAGGAR